MNAGIASEKSLRSISLMQLIMKKPTKISTGAVACVGMAKNTAEKNNDKRKNTEITKAVRPDLPPAATPAALST